MYAAAAQNVQRDTFFAESRSSRLLCVTSNIIELKVEKDKHRMPKRKHFSDLFKGKRCRIVPVETEKDVESRKEKYTLQSEPVMQKVESHFEQVKYEGPTIESSSSSGGHMHSFADTTSGTNDKSGVTVTSSVLSLMMMYMPKAVREEIEPGKPTAHNKTLAGDGGTSHALPPKKETITKQSLFTDHSPSVSNALPGVGLAVREDEMSPTATVLTTPNTPAAPPRASRWRKWGTRILCCCIKRQED